MAIPNWIYILIILLAFAGVMIYLELFRSKYVLSTTHRAVTLNNLPKALEGMKFVVISDLHSMSFGEKNSNLVYKIKRERPDYILFTGNMGNARSVQVDGFYDFMDAIGHEIPVVMVPGREDLCLGNGTVHKNFADYVTKAGGVILNNTRAEINVGGEKIYLYGFCPKLKKDANRQMSEWKFKKVRGEDVEKTLGVCPKDATVILLTNYAKGFEAYARWGANVIFAGGTHGGYCRVPIIDKLTQGSSITYTSGEYRMGRSKMYVGRGLSSSSRRRFNNSPEISVVSLYRPNNPVLKTMPVNEESLFDVFMYWFNSEGRAIRELLNERTDTIRDWWASVTNKNVNEYAKRGDINKEKNLYLSPNERAKENAKRAMKANGEKNVLRISRVQSRSEFNSRNSSDEDGTHSYDRFMKPEEIDKIEVFKDIKDIRL